MGYSCAAVSYAIENVGKPIVFTGSQVSYGMIGTDAVMNLENTIRVIADDECELVGVCCVFGSKVITGTRVKKKTEFDYDAFKTFGKLPDLANIGNRIVYNKEAFEYLQKKQIPIVVTTQAPEGVASMQINEPRTISIGIGSNTCLGYEHGKYGHKIVLVNRQWLFL